MIREKKMLHNTCEKRGSAATVIYNYNAYNLLTFISKSFFHLGNLDFLFIGQNGRHFPIGHELECVGACHRKG